MSDNTCNFNDCNKKLGLVKFKCKCGSYYCSFHRQSFDHKCKYNYVADAKHRLEKDNVKVIPDKIIKI